jgi:hypothetical protein
VKAPSDGYTLLMVSGAHAVNATLSDRLNFNVIRDISPVAGIIQLPLRTGSPAILNARGNPLTGLSVEFRCSFRISIPGRSRCRSGGAKSNYSEKRKFCLD